MDYAALRTELLTDPVSLGYAALSHEAAAARIMATNTGRTLPRTSVTRNEIIREIRNADYPTTSAGDQIKWNKLNLLLSTDTIDANNQNVKDTFGAIFAAGTATRTALLALATRTVSRAEELGLGFVSPGDVELARTKDGGW